MVRLACALAVALAVGSPTTACSPEPMPPSYRDQRDAISEWLRLLDELASRLESELEAGTAPEAIVDSLEAWLDETETIRSELGVPLARMAANDIQNALIRHSDVHYAIRVRLISIRARIEALVADDPAVRQRFRKLARRIAG